MKRPPVEHRKTRGETKDANASRRAAARNRARDCIAGLMKSLDGYDADFVVDVLRAVVRAVGSALAQRAGVSRAVGVLVGTLTNVCPAWQSEATDAAQSEAEALFRRDAA